MYVIWLIPCAVAPNIGTMLVSRFLDGFAGSAFLSVAGGTVGDMFAKHELSLPVSDAPCPYANLQFSASHAACNDLSR